MAELVHTVNLKISVKGLSVNYGGTSTKVFSKEQEERSKGIVQDKIEAIKEFARNLGVDLVVDGGIQYPSIIFTSEQEAYQYNLVCEQEEEQEEAWDAYLEKMSTELDIKTCIYSMKKPTTLDLTELFTEGPAIFYYDGGWGSPVASEVIDSPTYADVWKQAEKAVILSKDLHHVFLEGASFKGIFEGVKRFDLYFGS